MGEYLTREWDVRRVTLGSDAVNHTVDGAKRWETRDAGNTGNAGDEPIHAVSATPDAPRAADPPRLASGTSLLTLVQGTAGASTVELAIAAWLHVKEQKSQSAKTRARCLRPGEMITILQVVELLEDSCRPNTWRN